MKKLKFRRNVRNMIGITILVFIIMAFMGGCTDRRSQSYVLSDDIISSEKDLSFSNTKKPDYEEISSWGIMSLYFDKNTASPAVKNNKKVWSALPANTAENSSQIPAVLSIEVLGEGQKFLLNSQTDCVKNQIPVYNKTDNGVYIEYVFDIKTEKESTSITIPVNFYLEDGSFYVSVDCDKISITNDYFVITKMSLMDFFGSKTTSNKNDYILVPDNCGAIIDISNAKSDFGEKSFKVYGDEEKNNALLGVFAMKENDSAFIGIIENGDAIATVNAQVAACSGYNRVGAEFEITKTMTKVFKDDEERIYVSGESYKGQIKICYRFIEGNKADYSGMAIACREHLIRTGVLSADTVDSSGNMPFILTAIGEASLQSGKSIVLTNYEQLTDMLTYLKGKGFSNIFVRYKGTFTGGVDQSDIENCKMLKTLGNKQQYKELTDYVTAQQVKLFFDMSITSCSVSGGKTSAFARDLSGAVYAAESENLLGTSSKKGFAAYDTIDDKVISVFDLAANSGISDLSINDAAAFLYCDDKSGVTRADMAQEIKTQTASLSTIGDIMAEKGNFYMLRNVSLISSLPLDTSIEESSCYKAVPFVPLLLHATTQYSCEPLNLAQDYTKAVLRCVEYGALPQFEWCYEEIEENDWQEDEGSTESSEEAHDEAEDANAQEEIKSYSYSDWATNAYNFYEKANKALGDIRGLRMTAHYQVKNGVYCTEYGDTNIYVNYTNKDVTVGGVIVPAKDFMRVN